MNHFIKQSFLLVTLFFLQHNFCFAQVKKNTNQYIQPLGFGDIQNSLYSGRKTNEDIGKIKEDLQGAIQSLNKYNIIGLDQDLFKTDYEYRSTVKAVILVESYFPNRVKDLRDINERVQMYVTKQVTENPKAEELYKYILQSDLDVSKADFNSLTDAVDPRSGAFYAMYHNPEAEKIAYYLQNKIGLKFIDNRDFVNVAQKVYENPHFINELQILRDVFGLQLNNEDYIKSYMHVNSQLLNIKGFEGKIMLENIKRLIDDGFIGEGKELEIPSVFDAWMTHRNSPYLKLYKETYLTPNKQNTLIAANETKEDITDEKAEPVAELSFEEKTQETFAIALESYYLTNRELTGAEKRQALKVINTTRNQMIANLASEKPEVTKSEKKQLKKIINKLTRKLKTQIKNDF